MALGLNNEQQKILIHQSIMSHLFLGTMGVYPLFPKNWTQYLEGEEIALDDAREIVWKMFHRMSRHYQYANKKKFMELIPVEEKQVFFRSFYCLLSHSSIDQLTRLQ